MEQKHYIKQTEIVPFQGKEIILKNFLPVLSSEQREKRKQEIEHQLYDVFRKYNDKARESS